MLKCLMEFMCFEIPQKLLLKSQSENSSIDGGFCKEKKSLNDRNSNSSTLIQVILCLNICQQMEQEKACADEESDEG